MFVSPSMLTERMLEMCAGERLGWPERPIALIVSGTDVFQKLVPRLADLLSPVADVLHYEIKGIRGRTPDAPFRASLRGRRADEVLARGELVPHVLIMLTHGDDAHDADRVHDAAFVLNSTSKAFRIPVAEMVAARQLRLPALDKAETAFVVSTDRVRLLLTPACNSARIGSELGEDAAGMARAAFATGVPAYVGAAWPVRDDSTAEGSLVIALWTRLLTALRDGATVHDAVALARRALHDRPFADWGYLTALGHTELAPFPRPSGTTGPRAE